MCGILFISNNKFDKDKTISALHKMDHRGPDNQSHSIKNGHFLGHTRLSIIDLNKRSNQPFSINEYTIIYNGEIYNYKELIREKNLGMMTDSDTEVVLRMYIKYGKKCLSHFNGMFSFVIYNEVKNEYFIARDRLGIKPLYYRKINDSYIFCSEIEPILNLKDDELDEFGIRQYKKLRMTIKGHTIYKNIKLFPAGHYFDGKYFLKY